MRPQDLVKGELIGLEIEVIDSPNHHLKGLKGKIIDETRNTLTVIHHNKEKKLIKDQITFITTMQGKKIYMKGMMIVGRPEERLKKKVKP